MGPPDLDLIEAAEVLLADDGAPVRVRTIAARVHYRRLLIGREATTSEAGPLLDAYARRRAVTVELARRYRA